MAFEPIFEVAHLDSLRRICVHQAVVEARLLSQGGVKIAKVLSIATTASVTPSETFSGEARYNGRISFKVIFTDPEGKNHSMDYNADFTDKLNSDEIKAGMKPSFSASVLDTDIVSVDERELKLACVAEVALDAVVSNAANLLTKGGENIYTHDDRLEFSRLIAETDNSFSVTDQLEDVACENILLAETRVVTTQRKTGIDSVMLEGNIICDLTCEDADGMIVSRRHVTPFQADVPVSEARVDDMVVASAVLSNQSVTLTTDGEKRSVSFEYLVTGYVKVFREDAVNPVTDAFSVVNELKTVGETLRIMRPKFNGTLSERVEGAVTLDVAMPIADTVLAVTGAKLNIASVTATASSVSYDGIVSASIVYHSVESNQVASVAVELPFSITDNRSEALDGDAVTAKGIVSAVTTKILRGNEIQIKAEIEIETVIVGVTEQYVITDLTIGEAIVLPSAAFSVHIAKGGETLWDIAKSLGMTPELVLTQNPGLSLPLAGGERVIAYRQLKR